MVSIRAVAERLATEVETVVVMLEQPGLGDTLDWHSLAGTGPMVEEFFEVVSSVSSVLPLPANID